MKTSSKRNLYNFTKKITPDILRAVISVFIILLVIVTGYESKTFSFWDFFDVQLISTIVVVVIGNIIIKFIAHFIEKKCEDAVKLNIDTDFSKLYCREKFISSGEIKYPVIPLWLKKCDYTTARITINDKKDMYEIPDIIKENFDDIIKVHSKSKIFNNINIRVDDCVVNERDIHLSTSRTTYINSLVTNRAMDYVLKNSLSLRSLFEPGPFISRLSESTLSNHIGFNAFVCTNDNEIIITRRKGNVSIAKDVYNSSVSASLKTKYALDDDRIFSKEGLFKAVSKEITDELKLEDSTVNVLEENLIAFVRDVVEGGKPHFMFYVNINKSLDEIKRNFGKEKTKEEDMVVDARDNGIYSIKRENFAKLSISNKSFSYGNKEFITTPTVAGLMVIAREYVRKLQKE